MSVPGVLPLTAKSGRSRSERSQVTPGARLSDTGNAERFAAEHGNDLRYCHPWRAWMVWDARRWTRDETGEVYRRAKTTVTRLYEAALEADGVDRKDLAAHAMKSDTRSRIAAMVELAQSEPRIPVLPDAFDADPWLLTVSNGTLDLRDGELREHRREDLLTKLVPVAYDASATCPLWEAFLDRVLAGDQELIAFVQRAVGYSLTGITREHCFFFLHGAGGNGKSTLLEVLRALFGELATHAEFATFLERKSDRGPRDMARFCGARFVTAIEAGEGRRFDEAALKSITGGDTITACRVFEQAFEFRPTFKIWLASNHLPVIRGTDRGMWRRLRLIPFDVEIPESEFDKDLDRKLMAELPGILAWAVRGCLAWQRDGLGAPLRVVDATAEYRAAMDTFGDFLRERCTVHSGGAVKASDLYSVYKEWALLAGEKPLSKKAVGMKLSERGFAKAKHGASNDMHYFGLSLGADDSGRSGAFSGTSLTRESISTLSDFTNDRPASSGETIIREHGTCLLCGRTGLPDGLRCCRHGHHLPSYVPPGSTSASEVRRDA